MYRCIQHYLQMLENKACDYLYNKMRFLVLLKKVENLAIRLLSYFISEVVKIKVFFYDKWVLLRCVFGCV